MTGAGRHGEEGTDALIHDEAAARHFLTHRLDVSRETFLRLERLAALVLEETERQNLIAPSTAPHIWARHIADSAQLLLHCDRASDRLWIDIGAGAGFPGLVVALLTRRRMLLVEPRPLRAEFLRHAARELDLDARVEVMAGKAQTIEAQTADIISARAVAPLPRLLAMAAHLSTSETRWLLPKGRNAVIELQNARRKWLAYLTPKPSLTDAGSAILVGTVKGCKT